MSSYNQVRGSAISYGRRSKRALNVVPRSASNGLEDVLHYFPDSEEEEEEDQSSNGNDPGEDVTEVETSFQRTGMQDKSPVVDVRMEEEFKSEDSWMDLSKVYDQESPPQKRPNNRPIPTHQRKRVSEVIEVVRRDDDNDMNLDKVFRLNQSQSYDATLSSRVTADDEKRDSVRRSPRKSAGSLPEKRLSALSRKSAGDLPDKRMTSSPNRVPVRQSPRKSAADLSEKRMSSLPKRVSERQSSRKSAGRLSEKKLSSLSRSVSGSLNDENIAYVAGEKKNDTVRQKRDVAVATQDSPFSDAVPGDESMEELYKINEDASILRKKNGTAVRNRRDIAVATEDSPLLDEVEGNKSMSGRLAAVAKDPPEAKRNKVRKRMVPRFYNQYRRKKPQLDMESKRKKLLEYKKLKQEIGELLSTSSEEDETKTRRRVAETGRRKRIRKQASEQREKVQEENKSKQSKSAKKINTNKTTLPKRSSVKAVNDTDKRVSRVEIPERPPPILKAAAEGNNGAKGKSRKGSVVKTKSDMIDKEHRKRNVNVDAFGNESDYDIPFEERFDRFRNEMFSNRPSPISKPVQKNSKDNHVENSFQIMNASMDSCVSKATPRRQSIAAKDSTNVARKRQKGPALVYHPKKRKSQSGVTPNLSKNTVERIRSDSVELPGIADFQSSLLYETPKSRTSWVGPSPVLTKRGTFPGSYSTSIKRTQKSTLRSPRGTSSKSPSQSPLKSSLRYPIDGVEFESHNISPVFSNLNTLPGRSDVEYYSDEIINIGESVKTSERNAADEEKKQMKRKKVRRITFQGNRVAKKKAKLDVQNRPMTGADEIKGTDPGTSRIAKRSRPGLKAASTPLGKENNKENRPNVNRKKSAADKFLEDVNPRKLVRGLDGVLTEMDLIFTPLMHQLNPINSQRASDILVHKYTVQPCFSAGVLRLLPSAEKRLQYVENNTMFYSIEHGEIILTIGDAKDRICAGCTFFVPPNNVYGITNTSDEEDARLLFIQIKSVI